MTFLKISYVQFSPKNEKINSENELITIKKCQNLWTVAILGPFLEISIIKKRNFILLSNFLLLTDKKAALYDFFAQKRKDLQLLL